MKDLQQFLGVEYAQLAEDDKLTYEILHSKGQYARFLEEVEQRINKFTPKAAQEIKDTVQLTYKHAYEGMIDAVEKSKTYEQLKTNFKGLRAVTPEIMKRAVENPISGLTLNDTLEKNRKEVIYSIKQQIGIGLSQGDRMSTMSRRISEQVDMDYRKATRIVRTETHRVREAGYQDSSERISQTLKDSGSEYVMTKTWKTMQDERVRPQVAAYKRKKGVKARKKITAGTRSYLSGPNHVKMHDVTILVDEEFDLGNGVTAKAPGQSGVAGHDINCRCYLSRDLMTREEYNKLKGITEPVTNKLTKKEHLALAESMDMTEKEHDAIYHEKYGYVGTSGYDRMNKVLRGEFEADILKDGQIETIQALDKVISKNKLNKNITVNRYVDDDFLEKQFGIPKGTSADDIVKQLTGKSYTEKGFLSTTSADDHMFSKSNRVHLSINAKKGTNVFVTDDMDEMEVLFGRGANLKFKSVKNVNGRIEIVADLIDYDTDDLIDTAKLAQMKTKAIVKKVEIQEKSFLDEKVSLEAKQAKLLKRQQNLTSYEYDNIWKDKVTPADYESKKGSIQAKRDYYNDDILNAKNRTGKYANTNTYSDFDLDVIIAKDETYLKMLDDFEAQGKTYVKLSKQLSDIDDQILDVDDNIKAVREKLMKVQNIDPKKMQKEIDVLTDQINLLSSSNKNLTIMSKVKDFDQDKLKALYKEFKPYLDDDKINKVFDLYSDDELEMLMYIKLSKAEQVEFQKKLEKLILKNDPKDAAKLKKLQKQLADKQDELNKIKKRYGLEDDVFSQARKDKAYWFTDKNGGAEAADGVLRDKCGQVWRNATKDQKHSAFEYTQSYHKYNEPLRGIEYGTNKFIGVGKVDLDDIGVSTGYGYTRGEVKKLIDDLTDIIDQSTYDFDYWVQRGCRYNGMDKFFNIDPDDFYKLSESEMRAKLLGTTPTEYAFMSTGVAKGKGLNVGGQGITLNIYAPKGTKMLYCEPFSAFGHGASSESWNGISTQSSFGYEAEILLQRNTQFRVTKVEKSGDRWFIDMEIINQQR